MNTTKLASKLAIAVVSVLSFGARPRGRRPRTRPRVCRSRSPTPVTWRSRPTRRRVDLCLPTFTHPTQITNPLFPVSSQESVLLVGRVDGQAFRTEVTLLDHTRVIPWAGMQVEVAVSQYVAFLGGRIHEVAYDLYAQDDAGNVWYFGEDVYNFLDGSIGDTHGTWIAGIDGPAAMIMPADPRPGDVYRPENIPGFVFEEVTVKRTGQPFRGPFANASGALVISELHMDGSRERKTFAPGYGEFFTSGGGDTEALALAVPTDAADGAMPAAVRRLDRAATMAYAAGMHGDAVAIDRAAKAARAAWRSLGRADVPRLLRPLLERAVLRLGAADEPERAAQAAIGLTRLAQDLRLRHRSADAVDLRRLDTWLAQMLLDVRRVTSRPCAGTSSRSTTSATGCGLLRRGTPRGGGRWRSRSCSTSINEGDLGSVREVAERAAEHDPLSSDASVRRRAPGARRSPSA